MVSLTRAQSAKMRITRRQSRLFQGVADHPHKHGGKPTAAFSRNRRKWMVIAAWIRMVVAAQQSYASGAAENGDVSAENGGEEE